MPSDTPDSVIHRLPSGPAVIATGVAVRLPVPYSVMTPCGVTLPTREATASVNHRFPSGPSAMSLGWLFLVSPVVNLLTVPDGVMRPMKPSPTDEVNHT